MTPPSPCAWWTPEWTSSELQPTALRCAGALGGGGGDAGRAGGWGAAGANVAARGGGGSHPVPPALYSPAAPGLVRCCRHPDLGPNLAGGYNAVDGEDKGDPRDRVSTACTACTALNLQQGACLWMPAPPPATPLLDRASAQSRLHPPATPACARGCAGGPRHRGGWSDCGHGCQRRRGGCQLEQRGCC